MNFKDLIGLTLTDVDGAVVGSEQIDLKCDDGRGFRLWHRQDCCEGVSVQDINGDVTDLVGSPITLADESTGDAPADADPSRHIDSETWTFYRIGTVKGTVVIRWLGQSNGYYSESVEFEQTEAPRP